MTRIKSQSSALSLAPFTRPSAEPRRHVLLYSPAFATRVLTGVKRCTIRARRGAAPQSGDLLEHRAWAGVPYRPGSRQVTIRESVCDACRPITIDARVQTIRIAGIDQPLTRHEARRLAETDGFETLGAFFAYFGRGPRGIFHGVLITWCNTEVTHGA